MTLPNCTLVLGGASSGKSKIAEAIVSQHNKRQVYIATSQVYDDEMRAKVKAHIAQRGPDWHTIEEPIDLPQALSTLTADDTALIDCLTLWLTNLLMTEADLPKAEAALITALHACPASITMVSNEVGLGIVPDNALARRFRVAQGGLNQRLAAQCSTVIGVMAGLPFALKGRL